jgi:hypothetical protein
MTNLNTVDHGPDGRRKSALDRMTGRIFDVVEDAHADGVSAHSIARVLVTVGKCFLAAAGHEPKVH